MAIDSEQLNIIDIYNKLFAGKKLAIEFPSPAAAERFRVRLQQFKHIQETSQLAIGLVDEIDIQRLSFLTASSNGMSCEVTAIVRLKPKVVAKTFEVLELSDVDDTGDTDG